MQAIDGYRCIREIASGGSGTIYLAEQRPSRRVVILKVLRATDANTVAAFEHEQQLIATLRLPHVPEVFASGYADGHPYVAMEYFPLGDLRHRMAVAHSPAAALTMLESIATALEDVHDAGVLHRDIKPGNILLRDDGSVALNDFGAAEYLTDWGALDVQAGSELRRIVGTPEYMSPEQGHGETLDVRSDLYSLGVILHELLLRRRPFTDVPPWQVIYLARHAPRPALGEAQAPLQCLLDRLLASRREARFANATELLREVRALRGEI